MVSEYGLKVSDVAVKGYYPRFLHKLMFSFDMPSLWSSRWFQVVSQCFKWEPEARLVFVQPVSLYFDTFFTAPFHEMIPFIWDCWPCYYDMMEKWLKKHKIKIAIFTSSQEMAEMQKRCPDVKMIWCPEAVDTSLYKEGKPLKDRSIDLLEFGRGLGLTPLTPNQSTLTTKINHVRTLVDGKFIYTDEQLFDVMGDAKVTICFPRSITNPDMAGGVETLTQRYWEAMLSRMIIIGHCPQELIDIIGYNPVIEINAEGSEVREQISDILAHIEDYQDLVDKNRTVAVEMGDWKGRIVNAMNKLAEENKK